MYWVEECPFKIHVHQKFVNVTLFGNRIFADIIKLRWSHIGLEPTYKDWYPYKKREIWRQPHTETRALCED